MNTINDSSDRRTAAPGGGSPISGLGSPAVIWTWDFEDSPEARPVPENFTAVPEVFTGSPDPGGDEHFKNREKQRNIGDSGWKSH